MDEILTTYLDTEFLSWLGDFIPLVVAGLFLGLVFYFLGWLVTTVISWVRAAIG